MRRPNTLIWSLLDLYTSASLARRSSLDTLGRLGCRMSLYSPEQRHLVSFVFFPFSSKKYNCSSNRWEGRERGDHSYTTNCLRANNRLVMNFRVRIVTAESAMIAVELSCPCNGNSQSGYEKRWLLRDGGRGLTAPGISRSWWWRVLLQSKNCERGLGVVNLGINVALVPLGNSQYLTTETFGRLFLSLPPGSEYIHHTHLLHRHYLEIISIHIILVWVLSRWILPVQSWNLWWSNSIDNTCSKSTM